MTFWKKSVTWGPTTTPMMGKKHLFTRHVFFWGVPMRPEKTSTHLFALPCLLCVCFCHQSFGGIYRSAQAALGGTGNKLSELQIKRSQIRQRDRQATSGPGIPDDQWPDQNCIASFVVTPPPESLVLHLSRLCHGPSWSPCRFRSQTILEELCSGVEFWDVMSHWCLSRLVVVYK